MFSLINIVSEDLFHDALQSLGTTGNEHVGGAENVGVLGNLLNVAVHSEDNAAEDEVGLFDTVTVYLTDEGEEEVFRLVTTLRQNPLNGLVSKESPIGSALMGKKVGDIVRVQVNESFGYDAKVIKIEKGTDDEDLPILKY